MKILKTQIKKLDPCKDGYPKHATGSRSVDIARAYFLDLGYHVTQKRSVSANGPDLVILSGSDSFRVEVKTSSLNKRAWRVPPVLRQEDDLVALVFPSGAVHVDSMSDHQALCTLSGYRYVTVLGRLYQKREAVRILDGGE
jgi:hypothetical protein